MLAELFGAPPARGRRRAAAYSPAVASTTGPAAEKYTGAALCGVPQGKLNVVNAVTEGTFTGPAVSFQ